MTPPKQKPGRSRQDYETPWELIQAVEHFLDIDYFTTDLAATEKNSKALYWLRDSLDTDWSTLRGWCWLNPPFADIGPWVRKCFNTPQANIALLVPASVGSEWFRCYVFNRARILALSPRISFDSKGPYPKDCILALYSQGHPPGFELWRWK